MTVLAFPGCEQQPSQPPRDPESEEVVLAELRDQLTDAAARLPLDSPWRAWVLRRAKTVNLTLGLRGVR
jgi:hypothetical protein